MSPYLLEHQEQLHSVLAAGVLFGVIGVLCLIAVIFYRGGGDGDGPRAA